MGWFCSLLFALSLSLENISRVDNVLKRLYVACAPVVGHLSNSMISVLKIKKSKIPWCPGGGYNQKSGQIPNKKPLSVMIRSQDSTCKSSKISRGSPVAISPGLRCAACGLLM